VDKRFCGAVNKKLARSFVSGGRGPICNQEIGLKKRAQLLNDQLSNLFISNQRANEHMQSINSSRRVFSICEYLLTSSNLRELLEHFQVGMSFFVLNLKGKIISSCDQTFTLKFNAFI
jgi:hypothetical protein